MDQINRICPYYAKKQQLTNEQGMFQAITEGCKGLKHPLALKMVTYE